LNWYAIYTRSRHEQKANGRLLEKKVETFLPLIERWSRRMDRRKRIRLPLFPGYLFVRTPMEPQSWVEVLKTDGVVRFLGNDGIPTPIPDEQISAVQVLTNKGVAVTPCAYLKEGMKVRVANGPLMGVEGFLLKAQPRKHRFIISVHLLQESVSVEIDELDIEPIHI
jgi:transcription elongation factor/antiterminator RfaH